MTRFDTVAIVDWSSGNDTGPRPKKDAIWAAVQRGDIAEAPVYLRNRVLAEAWLSDLIERECSLGRRTLIGFDFPFGYPEGFAEAVTGSSDPFAVWRMLSEGLKDTPQSNNRFQVAAELNAMFDGGGPFWFNASKADIPGLPRKKPDHPPGLPERRAAERLAKGAFTLWQMGGAGAVGGQAMTGITTLQRLRETHPDRVAVWPFEPLNAPVAFVEVWPSLVADVVRAIADPIKDRAQVATLAAMIAGLSDADLSTLLSVDAPEEGWIFGVDAPDLLRQSWPAMKPRLKNDCFALPPGVNWTPVDDALARLQNRLSPVTDVAGQSVADALGLYLAENVVAKRSNPPAANSAVDGYGCAATSLTGADQTLPLVEGRAAAGAPFTGTVPEGHAVRILTGALLPAGVDTVILEEDVTAHARAIDVPGGVKPGSNARKAGEDVAAGDVILEKGARLGPPELALLAATGVTEVTVFRRLRVGVLSTGDELAAPGETEDPARTYDANRPMLLGQLQTWGFEAVDLGHSKDDRADLKALLDDAAGRVDAILTSGGASAGDEDHVSALLGEIGSRADWRIALKPGRPLALGVWDGVPVFGLPGNPVAALVCTLVFGGPALSLLAGGTWRAPQGFTVPAAFSKRKKAGRREYLRARLTPDGRAEVFKSEGSGRISGLAWAEGLVELEDGARDIGVGDPVRFIPYAAFGPSF